LPSRDGAAVRLLLSAAFATDRDVGISLYLRRLAPCLARMCDLRILTPDPELFRRYGETIRVGSAVRDNVRRLLWTLACLPAYCTRDCDVVLCPTPAVPVPSPIPTVAVVHDLTPLKVPALNPAREKAVFWAGLQTLRSAGRVITDSCHTRNDLVAAGVVASSRIRVARCGPGVTPSDDDVDFALCLRPFILYVGSFAPHKNLPRLLRAFARLAIGTDLRLILAGDASPEQAERVTALAGLLGIAPRLSSLRRLTSGQLSSLYRHCQLLACPSLYEGFGLPVLEAMTHGAPVACSSASSLPEVAGDAAVLFDPLSVHDMAEKMQSVLVDSALSDRLRELGRTRSRMFSWERTAEVVYSSASELV
jgi:glycosyltransferase involved in cell wall biosynthesis